MLLSLLLFESEFLHIVAISFTALVINELIMVALEITTWHTYMVLSELGTALVYFGSMAILPEYFGACILGPSPWLTSQTFALCCPQPLRTKWPLSSPFPASRYTLSRPSIRSSTRRHTPRFLNCEPEVAGSNDLQAHIVLEYVSPNVSKKLVILASLAVLCPRALHAFDCPRTGLGSALITAQG